MMEDQIGEPVQIEEVEVVKPKGFNHHLIYSILPFIIIIGSLFVGKLVVDYLSRDEAPKNEIAEEVGPTSEPTIASPSITLRTSPTPSPKPTVRPEDPLANDTQRRYTNGTAGISLLYPKEWAVEGESNDVIDGNIPTFSASFKSGNIIAFTIRHNPYEFYHSPVKKTEALVVGGRGGELKVTGFCTEEEKQNAAVMCDSTGLLVVQIGQSPDTWIFTMPVETQAETDVAIQKMKDFLSTVKFL